ncbi:MAG: Holliday junction resolvase RuvX [Pseudomonadota bacterium]
MRIMALDLGSVRVGVALSDEMGLTAGGLTVLKRDPQDEFLRNLKELSREHNCGRIVLGLPRRMDGSLGPEAQRVLALARDIEACLGLPVETWDERLSTVAVEKVLLQADLSRRKRKKVIDKVAAAYILQSYLDYLAAKGKTEA